MKVTKRNGNITVYDDDRVSVSILKANEGVPWEDLTPVKAKNIAGVVFERLTAQNEIITTDEIRSCVNDVLFEFGFPLTARNYMDYKK
ncbi:MAG: hypothetical protein IJQ02_13705 [Oscillospiraceae bacterium]|nr:hypothetical protein [Oscillospiraceae bacterium]